MTGLRRSQLRRDRVKERARGRRALLLVGVLLMAACAGRTSPPASTQSPAGAAPSGPASSVPVQTAAPCGPSQGRVERLAQNAGLFSIQMATDEVGWAVGTGLILGTRDGGRNWDRQLATQETLTFVDAIDQSHIWAVGRTRLLGSSDGGTSWLPLGEPPRPLTMVHFVDPRHGWGVTESELYESTDGGRSWNPLRIPCEPDAVCFSGDLEGWLGSRGRIYHSVDGGRRWTLTFGVPGWEDSARVEQLQCAGAGVVWVRFLGGSGGGLGHYPYIVYRGTADGPWTPVVKETQLGPRVVQAPPGGTSPAPISAISANEAAVLNYSAAANDLNLVVASDGGSTLSPARSIPVRRDLTPRSAAFRNGNLGWVVTGLTEARIHVTRDGGATWQVQYPTP